MSQLSTSFLLIAPELFQGLLINILLLFAICFSYYKIGCKTHLDPSFELTYAYINPSIKEKTSKHAFDTNDHSNTNARSSVTPNKELGLKKHGEHFHGFIYRGYNITPMLQVETLSLLVILSLSCCCALYINNPLTYALGYHSTILWDNLARHMSVLLCLSTCASLALAVSSLKRFGRYEFVFIIWLSVVGMLTLIKSYNFLALYLNIELQSLSFYMLASMRSRTEASAEAGLKYFILSAFSSALLLLGLSLIYGGIGCQNFSDLEVCLAHFATTANSENVNLRAMLNVGLGCVIISLLFKCAAVPFHAWIADVYEGSPTPITAFFAITSKIAVTTALIRMLDLSDDSLEPLLACVAGLSLMCGSLSAMRQVKLKRLLAFSGVANVGWFLLALISGAWDLLIMHLIIYILTSTTLFCIFVLPLFRTHPNLEYRERIDQKHGLIDHGADSQTLKYINDLSMIYKNHPGLAFVITVAMFSLAGMPPLAGFYSKYLILNALTQAEQYLMLGLALGVAVLSAYYYLRIIKTMYFSNSEPRVSKFASFSMSTSSPEANLNAYICAFTTFVTLLFFIRPDYICIWIGLTQ